MKQLQASIYLARQQKLSNQSPYPQSYLRMAPFEGTNSAALLQQELRKMMLSQRQARPTLLGSAPYTRDMLAAPPFLHVGPPFLHADPLLLKRLSSIMATQRSYPVTWSAEISTLPQAYAYSTLPLPNQNKVSVEAVLPISRASICSLLGKFDSKPVLKSETSEDKVQNNTSIIKSEATLVKKVSLSQKIKKQNNECGHNDRAYYAKGFCNQCYHKKNRSRKPDLCPHSNLYARGLCQKCYSQKYKTPSQPLSL